MSGRIDPLFRGFITIDGKQATMSFRDVPSERLLDEATADRLGDYAAVLGDNTVVIDIDDEETSDRIFKAVKELEVGCRVYETSRGKHFVFFNDGSVKHSSTGATLVCGVLSDIKCGLKNSYIVRKKNGVKRKVLLDRPVQKIPCWLKPIAKRKGRLMLGLGDGDGRNSELYSYILSLQSSGFPKNDIKTILRVINEYVFDEPLDTKELETVLRDESFQEMVYFDGDGKFLFDIFSKHLAESCNLINVRGRLMSYNGESYIAGDKVIESMMIKEIPNLNMRQRKEVLAYLEIFLPDMKDQVNIDVVPFRNGLYDIIEDKMIPLTPEIITTNPIPHNYRRDAYSKIGDEFLNDISCNDPNLRSLIEEIIGFSFLRKNELRKSFLLFGGRHNGKSTFLDILTRVLGEDNITSLDLKDIGEKFKTAELYSKLACIGDDIDDDFIKDLSVFKKVVSGDRLNAERKNKDPFDFNPYAKLFFSANSIPRLKDRTGAVLERLVIVPFLAEFDSSNPKYDPFIKYKLRNEDCLEYFISVGIQGLRRVLAAEAFTECDKVRECVKSYDEDNDNVMTWLTLIDPIIENHSVTETYANYRNFCVASNLVPLSINEFGKQLRRREGYSTKVAKVDGKSIRIYTYE